MQLIIVDANGCNDTIIQMVSVLPNPIAYFSADLVCQGDETQFTDLSFVIPPGQPIIGYSWDMGGNGMFVNGTDGTLVDVDIGSVTLFGDLA